MKIYFDNVLINQDYYMSLTQQGETSNSSNSFTLGKTLCNSITLQIDENGVSSIPDIVKLEVDDTTYGYYIVDSYTKNNGYYEFNLADKMVNFNFNYSAKSIIDASATGYVTLLAILQDICTKGDVTLASNSTTFYGYDKHITWYDDSITARDYIGYIAELNAGFARINKSGELELVRMSNTPVQTISTDECKSYDIGEYHKISRIVCDDGLGTFTPVGDTTNDTLYLDSTNVYITEQSDLTTIYNAVKDLEYYSIKIEQCPISSTVQGFDSLKLTDGTNNYYFFAQLNNEYNGGWVGGYEFKVNSSTQAETEIKGTNNEIKSIKTTIDRDEAQMAIISSKIVEVSDTKSGTGSITLANAYEGILHKLTIKGDISKKFPSNSDDLYGFTQVISSDLTISNSTDISAGIPASSGKIYPSSTLYPLDTYLKVDDDMYHLDIDFLNYINDTTCDEYIYEDGTQKIIRRVGVNSSGTLYALDNEITEIREDLDIYVKATSTLSLLSFTSSKLSSLYLTQNDYTSVFANRVETKAEINLTNNKIEQTVSAVTDTDGKITPASIVLSINNDTSTASISADKVGLSGEEINLTSKDLAISSDNFNVDSNGNMTCNNAVINGTIQKTTSLGNVNIGGGVAGLIELNATQNGHTYEGRYNVAGLRMNRDNVNLVQLRGSQGYGELYLSTSTGASNWEIVNDGMYFYYGQSSPKFAVYSDGEVSARTFTPSSIEELKKNIVLYEDALTEVKNTDIYTYNMKDEEDTSDKHIGFVIGKNRNYSHKITSKRDGKEIGADLYSMISVLWEAVKEQQEQIEELKEKIKEKE